MHKSKTGDKGIFPHRLIRLGHKSLNGALPSRISGTAATEGPDSVGMVLESVSYRPLPAHSLPSPDTEVFQDSRAERALSLWNDIMLQTVSATTSRNPRKGCSHGLVP